MRVPIIVSPRGVVVVRLARRSNSLERFGQVLHEARLVFHGRHSGSGTRDKNSDAAGFQLVLCHQPRNRLSDVNDVRVAFR